MGHFPFPLTLHISNAERYRSPRPSRHFSDLTGVGPLTGDLPHPGLISGREAPLWHTRQACLHELEVNGPNDALVDPATLGNSTSRAHAMPSPAGATALPRSE
jgi:hypothetical protein